MYVRFSIATPKEGMTETALNYFRDVAIPVYDNSKGLLSAGACLASNGKMMAWTMWANKEAKESAMDKFNQNVSGIMEHLSEPPIHMEGPMVAGQQYIMVPNGTSEGEDDHFFARFVIGAGAKEGKTYDDVGAFMRDTVYPAYENVDGIYASAACQVDETSGFSFNFWEDHDAANGASDVIASVVKEAVENLISEEPQELTGQCHVWKNYVDFPVGKS